MANWYYTVFVLLLAIHGSIQKSSPTSSTYRAAVAEFGPVEYRNDSAKMLDENAKKFVQFIEQAAKKDADIIVFPELALNSMILDDTSLQFPLTTLIPDPSENYTPCTNFSIPVNKGVWMIACAAQRNSIYVVVNLLEKEECSGVDCPSNGIFVYITSVAFDREGKIVARYRKSHLTTDFGYLKVMKIPEISTFDTDFGVTFGMIICFDIMYEEPWLTLTRKLNITDIIFPSGWGSDLPFLTSIQVQAGWAYVEDVNLLVSGFNEVDWGLSGSGIYAGRDGVVTAILPLDHCEELLIADVRKKINKTMATLTPQHDDEHDHERPNMDSEYEADNQLNQGRDFPDFLWAYDELDNFTTEVIAEEGFIVKRLNHSGIDCTFQVNLTNLSPPLTYRLLAYDNVRSFVDNLPLGVRVCAIVQCANDTIDSCGHIRNSSATFNAVIVTATYIENMRTTMMPSTLGTNMLPLKNWSMNQYKQADQVFTSISLTTPGKNLVTFGLWGRNYEKDLLRANEFTQVTTIQ